MHAATEQLPAAAAAKLDDLGAAMTERGFVAQRRGRVLLVRNPRQARMQELVTCRPVDGAGWEFWAVSETPPFRLCPADDIAQAATVLARVLGVRET